jgi:hypothetical protein
LAEYINTVGREDGYDDARLFETRNPGALPQLRARSQKLGNTIEWRNLDKEVVPEVLLADAEFMELYERERERQARIRELPENLTLEESVVLSRIMRDIVLPANAAELGFEELPLWGEPLAIGTCPLAEKYFLELADRFVRRRGKLNVICSQSDTPLLIEKLGLGDDHSCISVVPLVLNGVCLPAGSLFGAHYETLSGTRPNAELPGVVIPLSECLGFRFLRLTTLSVSPENRPRAFSKHFDAQVANGLFDPGGVAISQLLSVAEAQLRTR